MATTSPDNLFSPNPSDNYNLIADWATSMQSVQAALAKRGNLYIGTAAQRTAFTTAPEGTHWQDTDGPKYEWVRQAGSWRGAKPLAGVVSTSGAAGATRNSEVSFPSGYFASTPAVTVTAQTSAPQNISGVSASGVSATGCTVYLRYVTATDINVQWVASSQSV